MGNNLFSKKKNIHNNSPQNCIAIIGALNEIYFEAQLEAGMVPHFFRGIVLSFKSVGEAV